MAKVLGKRELCISTLKYFKSEQGINGKTLFDRYPALENIIKSYVDARYRYFLAQPVKEDESIVWFTRVYNQTPRLITELQSEDLEKYVRIKKDTIIHYNETINNLKISGKEIEANFLSESIKFIDDRFIYCYDDIVVLAIWGMQLKDNIRESIGIAFKNGFTKMVEKQEAVQPEDDITAIIPTEETETETSHEPEVKSISEIEQKNENFNLYTVFFNPNDFGKVIGESVLKKQYKDIIREDEIPRVVEKEGFEFIGWDKNPNNYQVNDNVEFYAQYRKIAPTIVHRTPWYERFLNWLKALFIGGGCLKWFLWLLLFLLLLLLVLWLFRSCGNEHPAYNDGLLHDTRTGSGGIYNPGDPYNPAPTPDDPDYRDILPPNQGVMPPIDTTQIIREPGNPSVLGNRLNILLESNDKSIMQLAKEFKIKYPDDAYKVVYYDNVVKRMQIEIPPTERAVLKQQLPAIFAPKYKVFVFDESLFEGDYTPNDPVFKDGEKSWYLPVVNAPQAWDISRGSKNVVIAIVDNGFNLKHPELKDKVIMPYNVWTHSDEIFAQSVDHGTHVAGTALATINNNIGIAGIASDCLFMPIQVANETGVMTITSILDGILYALYQGADVVNCSLGTQFTGLDKYPENVQLNLLQNHFKEEERLWNEIMKIADEHNVTIVVAAGNDNVLAGIEPLQRPKQVITVSAVDKSKQNFTKSDFSNYGSYSTISAPGVGIFSTVGKDGYTSMDGTSMAAPIVTGAVALMKSLNKNLTSEQIICTLQNSGVETNGNIGNLIQIKKALKIVKSGAFSDCGKQPDIPSSGDVQVLLGWNNYNDLDIVCVDPQGNSVWFKNKKVPSGGQLEIDMNVEADDSNNPIENIFWPSNAAPEGTYDVYLIYYQKHESTIDATPFVVTVKYGAKTEKITGVIKKDDNTIHICSFTLGVSNDTAKSSQSKIDDLVQKRTRLQQELDRIDNELSNIEKNNNFRK